MTLAELIQEVYALTGRPDRVSETAAAIRAATLKMHQHDYWYKDMFEAGLAFDTPEYVQSLDYRAIIPRYRSLKYLRKYELSSASVGSELNIILPDQIFDLYQTEKTDIAYVAGAYIQIKSSTQQQYYIIGCYLNPDITDAGYNSWIALDHPYAIIFEAAATVFKAIGKDEEAAQYRKLTDTEYMAIQTSNVESTGI